jgi:hypothetical protein
MKTPEDEAFDDLARRQGDWGSGFQIKPRKAEDKLFEDQINYGTSWSKNGERIDPASVYLDESAQEPKRPWVGLTFAELCECENDSLLAFARAIEAKLKEKNT